MFLLAIFLLVQLLFLMSDSVNVKIMGLASKTHNPFNIRYLCANRWIGQLSPINGFCAFLNVDYGVRAGIITLKNYVQIYKLTSVRLIIKRYAPNTENDTAAYIRYVERQFDNFGVNTQEIKFGSYAFFLLCKSICYYECRYVLTKEFFDYIVKKFSL